jgi:hypothetical protein
VKDGHHLRREGPAEPAPRLDRRADDDELGAVVARDLGELVPERPIASADDLPVRCDAVRLGDGGCVRERGTECLELAVEMRIERKLLRDDQRRDEYDVRTAVGRQAAGEIERMVRLGAPEERHDDAAVPDRGRAAGEAAGPSADTADVRPLHRI